MFDTIDQLSREEQLSQSAEFAGLPAALGLEARKHFREFPAEFADSFQLQGDTTTFVVDVPLGFMAQTVIVANYTPNWLWIDGAYQYVSPNTYNAVLLIPSGTQRALARWEAPPGVAQGAGLANSRCYIRYYAQEYPPCPGLKYA